MTQRNLAEAIGYTSQHISAIEHGAKVPMLETFVAIATALRVPTDVLLQDVLPDWWDSRELEIDRVLALLLPHMRTYFSKQIVDCYQMEELCSRVDQRFRKDKQVFPKRLPYFAGFRRLSGCNLNLWKL